MKSPSKKLIQGGCLLTMDPDLGNFDQGDILIENGRIEQIGPSLKADNAEIIDASGRIVMPGFVDAHRHMWQTQLRSMTADWSLFDYSARIRMTYSSFYTPHDAYLGTYIGYLDALNAGCTTIVDHCHIINSPDHSDEVIRAFRESRARGIFCYGLYANPRPEDHVRVKTFLERIQLLHEDARKVKQKHFSLPDDRISFGVALTEAEWFPIELTAEEIHLARQLDAHRISAHAGMGVMSGHTRFVKRLSKADLLGPDLLFVHGWSLSDDELKLIAESGGAVVTTPETELQMGMGFPVTNRVLKTGGNAAIGIDIVSNQSADMFTQMRLILQVQRALENAELAKKGLMPKDIRFKVKDVLELATIKGARAIGLDDKIGSLTPGKAADIITIRMNDINMAPVTDVIGSVVLSAHVGNIDRVIVGGEVIKDKGQIIGIDWEDLFGQLVESKERILGSAHQKGFGQGEEVALNIFPVTKKSAREQRLGAWILQVPVPAMHRALVEFMKKR
jgi:5-methylthioadenosine/S-adenosylhomocysteine deaminase